MKIFYLMGKSSTGKDTIFKLLMSDKDLNLVKLIPHTTRPIRFGEQHGVDYYFYSDEEFNQLCKEGKVIESRSYQTKNGIWTYFTPLMTLDDKSYMTIGTLESYKEIKKVYGDALIPIYIELDDGIRLQRALTRELTQNNPKYAEMCRRYLSDTEDFAEEKLTENNINIRFQNKDLETCVTEIKNYILTRC